MYAFARRSLQRASLDAEWRPNDTNLRRSRSRRPVVRGAMAKSEGFRMGGMTQPSGWGFERSLDPPALERSLDSGQIAGERNRRGSQVSHISHSRNARASSNQNLSARGARPPARRGTRAVPEHSRLAG
jgi:hypothetical protein